MELFGSYTSPFVRHCRTVLLQTGLDCAFSETAASGARSPTHRVPYLHDGELKLSDSASIVRHLRERGGNRFCRTSATTTGFAWSTPPWIPASTCTC